MSTRSGVPLPSGRWEPTLLHEFFEAQVARRPVAAGHRGARRKMTYEELDELANQIAHWLRARGVGRGSPGRPVPDANRTCCLRRCSAS